MCSRLLFLSSHISPIVFFINWVSEALIECRALEYRLGNCSALPGSITTFFGMCISKFLRFVFDALSSSSSVSQNQSSSSSSSYHHFILCLLINPRPLVIFIYFCVSLLVFFVFFFYFFFLFFFISFSVFFNFLNIFNVFFFVFLY